jgi:hypothetical protein
MEARPRGPYVAVFSKARLVVRGPKRPIVAITRPIAAGEDAEGPERSSTKAMMKELKMTESRLQD